MIIYSICFFLALAIIVFAVTFCIIAKIKKSRTPLNEDNDTKKGVNLFYVLAISAFLSAFVLFIPIYADIFNNEIIKTILLSIHNTIRLFAVDADFDFVISNIYDYNVVTILGETIESGTSLYLEYRTLMAILYFACPMFTFGVILSFLHSLTAQGKLLLSFFKDMYVFSELNEKSLSLAIDIKNKNRKRTIVFCGTDKVEDEELLVRATNYGAILIKQDVLSTNFKFHSKNKDLRFFAINTNEETNVTLALDITSLYDTIDNSYLYVLSNNIESEMLLSALNSQKMIVKRINEPLSLINKLLYDEGKDFFLKCTELPNGNKKISIIIVGLGDYGKELLKTLVWFCQMVGYELEINAFDKNPNAKDIFAQECPEITKEYGYNVTIYSNVDIFTNSFIETVKSIKDVSFAFVSLGEDELNIQTAVNLRVAFERMGVEPIIKTIVYNTKFANKLTEHQNTLKAQKEKEPEKLKRLPNNYNIDYIGDLKSLYSEDVIINSAVEQVAIERHLKYTNRNKSVVMSDLWKIEYNYRSSIASALHLHVREQLGIVGTGKKEGDLTDEEKAVLGPLEHLRWNAYTRSIGYIFSGENRPRNDLGKMHTDLISFDELSEEKKILDYKVGSK